MMTQYIKVSGDVASLPLATAQPASVAPTKAAFSVDASVDDNDVNLRTGPSFDFPSQGKYSRGTPLKVLGRSLNDEWLKVTVAGARTGWMMTQYIALNTDLSSIPTVDAPPQPSPAPAKKPILMALVSKSYQPIDTASGIYDDYIAFTLEITNKTGKKIRAFTGSLAFYDLFDRYIYSGQLTYEDGLAAGGTVRTNRTISYNQFLDSHVRLRSIKTQDVKTAFSIEEIIFSDGSRQSYP